MDMKQLQRIMVAVALVVMLVAAMPANVSAEEAAQNDRWQFDATLYMWMTGMNGKTATGDDFKVTFGDLLDNLDFAFMGVFEAHKGRLSLLTDAMYLKLEAENGGKVTGQGGLATIKADATIKLQAWVVTPAIAYNIVDTNKFKFEVLAGARYLWIKPELDLHIKGPFRSRDKNISASGDVWDGIVGIRGSVNLDKHWYIPYYADIGTGESQFTDQVMAGVGYRISDKVDVAAAYRYMYWKFEENKVLDKLNLSGPVVGLRYRF